MIPENVSDALGHVREAESILREAQRALAKARKALMEELPELPPAPDTEVDFVVPPAAVGRHHRSRLVLEIIKKRIAGRTERKWATIEEVIEDGAAIGIDEPGVREAVEVLVRSN